MFASKVSENKTKLCSKILASLGLYYFSGAVMLSIYEASGL